MKKKPKLKAVERFKPDPHCECRKLAPGLVRTEKGVAPCPCFRAWKERGRAENANTVAKEEAKAYWWVA